MAMNSVNHIGFVSSNFAALLKSSEPLSQLKQLNHNFEHPIFLSSLFPDSQKPIFLFSLFPNSQKPILLFSSFPNCQKPIFLFSLFPYLRRICRDTTGSSCSVTAFAEGPLLCFCTIEELTGGLSGFQSWGPRAA